MKLKDASYAILLRQEKQYHATVYLLYQVSQLYFFYDI